MLLIDAGCEYAGYADVDGDADRSVIAWEVDGVPTGVGPTLELGFGVGDSVVCVVTPNDGTDAGVPVRSDAVEILPAGSDEDAFALCASAGSSSDGTFTMTHCTGPVAQAAPESTDGTYRLQVGPITHTVP